MTPQAKSCTNNMTIDNKKRSTMKILAVASGAMAAPGLVAAACKHGIKPDIAANTALRGTGLVISFTDTPDTGGARQVIVTNTSDQPVKLSHVYPSLVSTPQGSYDLNSLLTNGPVEFAPKHSTTLTIESAKITEAAHSAPRITSPDTWISVRTRNSHINSGRHVTTVRYMYS